MLESLSQNVSKSFHVAPLLKGMDSKIVSPNEI